MAHSHAPHVDPQRVSVPDPPVDVAATVEGAPLPRSVDSPHGGVHVRHLAAPLFQLPFEYGPGGLEGKIRNRK